MRLLASLAVLCAAAAPAEAQRVYARITADGRAGVGELDLAEQAGQEPSGDSQIATIGGGLCLAAGIRSSDLRVGLEAGLLSGGLDRAEIEQLYLGAGDGSGRALTFLIGLAAAVDRPLSDHFATVGRLGLGFALLSATASSGSARVETLYMDFGGGIGLELGTAIPTRIEALATLRVHRVYRVDVTGLSEGRVVPDAPAVFVQPGIQLGYVVFF